MILKIRILFLFLGFSPVPRAPTAVASKRRAPALGTHLALGMVSDGECTAARGIRHDN